MGKIMTAFGFLSSGFIYSICLTLLLGLIVFFFNNKLSTLQNIIKQQQLAINTIASTFKNNIVSEQNDPSNLANPLAVENALANSDKIDVSDDEDETEGDQDQEDDENNLIIDNNSTSNIKFIDLNDPSNIIEPISTN